MTIQGIHHVTAVSGDAGRTARFYTETLGMRLVKRTVNFDDPSTYHLYFGDEAGRPGTLLTFFDWPHLPRGATGVGATHHIALAVDDEASQLQWKRRLTDRGVEVTGPYDRRYFRSIYFTDPDGLILEIATRGPGFQVDDDDNPDRERLVPLEHLLIGHRDEAAITAHTWPEAVPEIAPAMRLRGIHHVTLMSSDAGRANAFYRDLLGLDLIKTTVNMDNPGVPHLYYGLEGGRPGTLITTFEYREGSMRHGRVGRGMTHHFAFLVEDRAEQEAWRERLLAAGLRPTPVMERVYFTSVYFHDPDGHIVEIATRGPGMLVLSPEET
ncbi:MAG: ring-cleaving dioxygenase [Ktedonobacterales bacterium]